MNYKEYDMDDDVFSYQRNMSLAIGIPSIVTPIAGSRRLICLLLPCSDFSSSTSVYTFSRCMSKSDDFCSRSLLPYSEDTHDRVHRSWNESPFHKSFSEISLFALQSLQDPILSPSSSSVSLDEMSQHTHHLFQFRL